MLKWKIFCLFLIICLGFVENNELPPIPELWQLEVDDIIRGVKQDNWLSNYLFLAPLRVKPGNPWNALIKATWTGPSLLDKALLDYLELEFDPLDDSYHSDWSGDKVLVVKSYNISTNIIEFAPKNNLSFMIAPKYKTGVYINMNFQFKIGNEKMPGMYVRMNTRLQRDVEVTCSDGLFCNGEERFVRGKCVNSKFKPCQHPSGDPCLSYKCIESDRQCDFNPIGGSRCKKCKTVISPNDTAKVCKELKYECGWNVDKTLDCGECPSTDYVCSANKCLLKSTLGEGSCNKPYQLYSKSLTIPNNGVPEFEIFGDLSDPKYIDHVKPICNPSAVRDIVYVFKIQSTKLMGIEVQMTKKDGTVSDMDTVLTLTDENCDPLELYSFCGDDNSPPGGVSSRIFGKLSNGTYKLVATAFSNVEANLQPYRLKVKFYLDCLPQCDGNRQCGSDGCGGVCGVCKADEVCHMESGRCRADPCVPDCTVELKNKTEPRTCGSDGCGSLCGSCNAKKSEMCVSFYGICKQVKICNHLLPECEGRPPAKMEQPYCAHDCKWHDMKENLGDLVPNRVQDILKSFEFDWRQITNRSCANVEGCLKKTGNRLLMRFDTLVHNIGTALFRPPGPEDSPNLFEWSPCHEHYHFDGFALFNLYDLDSRLVLIGGKRGYCMEDTVQTQIGNSISCTPQFDCSHQGIQPGWADYYPNVLDCQWLDITEIEKEKWYIYEICSNVDRKLTEQSNTNDCKRYPIYIPDVPFGLEKPPLYYEDILKERNIKEEDLPKINQEPGSELSVSLQTPTTNKPTTRRTTKRN